MVDQLVSQAQEPLKLPSDWLNDGANALPRAAKKATSCLW